MVSGVFGASPPKLDLGGLGVAELAPAARLIGRWGGPVPEPGRSNVQAPPRRSDVRQIVSALGYPQVDAQLDAEAIEGVGGGQPVVADLPPQGAVAFTHAVPEPPAEPQERVGLAISAQAEH